MPQEEQARASACLRPRSKAFDACASRIYELLVAQQNEKFYMLEINSHNILPLWCEEITEHISIYL